MSDFKAKMHQNRFCSPILRCWNKGKLLLREGESCREGKEWRGRRTQGKGREREGRRWEESGKGPRVYLKFSLE